MYQSTYRIQLNHACTLKDVARAIPYFSRLGIDALYLSPIFCARKGSLHGYDVTDPHRINPELGGEEALLTLARIAHHHNIDLIADVVANHMAASVQNPWWRDVLEHGKASSYASFFDIDWDHPRPELKGKILIPFLKKPLAETIGDGDIRLVRMDEKLVFETNFHTLPCAPITLTDTQIADINSDSKKLLDLLGKQHYLLEPWEVGYSYINYRRFFDINDLVALRAEEDHVFEAYHSYLFELIQKGILSGIRVDHPDGLKDPKTYFQRLRARGAKYIVVEKILSEGESLPKDWDVDGTVGYEYLNALTGIYVDQSAEQAFTAHYASVVGEHDSEAWLIQNKRMYAKGYLQSEIYQMVRAYCPKDVREEAFFDALVELLAVFPVYRTYGKDEQIMNQAFSLWKCADERIRKVVMGAFLEGKEPKGLLERFQQISPPAMAKGLEDTHFYQYNRFVALNEVGGHPHSFGTSIEAFHQQNSETAYPQRLLPAATHDTKRSEDARLRLCALSEVFDEWEELVASCLGVWEKNTVYFLLQTLIAAAPIENGRLLPYMRKACREAKEQTNWVFPNVPYEEELEAFVCEFVKKKEILPLAMRCDEAAFQSSISSLILRIGSPGVVDIYQGTEVPFVALVDPDNRRKVSFARYERLLEGIANKTKIPHTRQEQKLFYVQKALAFRQRNPKLCTVGEYQPLECTSRRGVGFLRKANTTALFVGLRFFMKDNDPKELLLPKQLYGKRWKDIFTHDTYLFEETVDLKHVLKSRPGTILELQ